MTRLRSDVVKSYAIALAAIALFTIFLYEFGSLTGETWNDAKHSILRLLPHPADTGGEAPGLVQAPGQPEPQVAQDDLFQIPPVNDNSIKVACSKTQWNQGLVFTCDWSFGGIGNIRNSILLCVRLAMRAGAALVLPRIVVRDDNIANYKTKKNTDFGYMFDTQHFLDSMQLSCPQMRVYATLDEVIEERSYIGDPDRLRLQAESLSGTSPGAGRLIRPETWRGSFYEWLKEQLAQPGNGNGTQEDTIIVNLDRSYMSYPIYSDGEAFAHSFSSILQPREDIRLLASKIIRGLAELFSFTDIDLAQPNLPNAFFGAHLRVEKDAELTWGVGDGWTHSTYERQAHDYLVQATSTRSSPKGIYVASGDVGATKRFFGDAAKHNLTALGKFDVLELTDDVAGVSQLRALRWDQQAIVDYLILLRASDFAGVAHSSFSWSIALKRHTFARQKKSYLNAPEKLHDDLSVVYGAVGAEKFPEALWP